MTAVSSHHDPRPCLVAAFDESPSGYDAAVLGRRLAELTDADLIVANIYLEALSAIDIVPPPDLSEQRHRRSLETAGHAGRVMEGFDRWTPVAYAAEPAARGLHELVERERAELIVVGSTHRHGLGRVVPGATAERLIHGASCPIAIAPAGWRGEAIGTIGVGFDSSPESAAALVAAATLARASGAALRAFSIFDPPDPANPVFAVTGHGYTEITGELRKDRRRRLDEALAHLPSGIDAGGEVVDGRPAQTLAERSEELDLLVIGSRGYGALRATLVGSVGHELAGTARCPLMLVPRGVERPLEGLTRRLRVSS